MPQKKLCFRWETVGQCTVFLHQTGRDSFTVSYGKQIQSQLSYGQAALELGACIMHALACNGDLDNQQRGER